MLKCLSFVVGVIEMESENRAHHCPFPSLEISVRGEEYCRRQYLISTVLPILIFSAYLFSSSDIVSSKVVFAL
jgi:hypothetical protein